MFFQQSIKVHINVLDPVFLSKDVLMYNESGAEEPVYRTANRLYSVPKSLLAPIL